MIRQRLETVLCDQIIALVSHSAHTFDIKSRLESHDIPGYEHLVALRYEVRGFRMP
jgi:hypothetical protein